MSLPGKLVIGDAGTSSQSILLDAATSAIEAGGHSLGYGTLSLKNNDAEQVCILSAKTCSLTLGCKSTLTRDDTSGQIFLYNKDGVQTAVLNGASGRLTLGGQGVNGDIVIKREDETETVKIVGSSDQNGGQIFVSNSKGTHTAVIDGPNGVLTLGGPGVNGDIVIKNSSDIETIKIIGESGDMEFLNADLAEEFEVAPGALSEARPGMVVVLDEEGRLVPCARPYDSSVVGILAGAGQYRPGIVLDKQSAPSRRPVTLVGKAFCWVDAQRDPVRPGDLLTTSANPGHAMRASSRRRSAGAVIGRALRPLLSGTGLVPVLVKPN